MPKRITPMQKREIVRRLRAFESITSIHRDAGLSRPTIRAFKELANRHGWLGSQEIPTEEEIAVTLAGDMAPRTHVLDSIRKELEEWNKKEYTYEVMTRMANKKLCVDLSEITVRRYVQGRFPDRPRAVIRREFAPGDVAEVDFGYMGLMTVEGEARLRKVWMFTMRPCFGRRPYRELVLDQCEETFFRCHMHAFEFFGGVFRKVVVDNLKSAVIKASLQDPMVNRSYMMLAEHYGFLVSACQPRKPEHKGGVEGDVKYVKGNFLPEFREEQRAKGYQMPDYSEAKESLARWAREVDDVHAVKYVGRTPLELSADERPHLQDLPRERWDPVEWKTAVVGDDWRIQVRKGFYSVPYEHIGQKVQVCMNSTKVVIYHDFRQIAWHLKVSGLWHKSIRSEHGPKNYKEYLAMTSDGTRRWAMLLGENVKAVVEALLNQRGVDGLRPARAVCGFAKKYGQAHLEMACARAVEWKTVSYRSVKRILQDGLAKPATGSIDIKPIQEAYRFSRTEEYSKL